MHRLVILVTLQKTFVWLQEAEVGAYIANLASIWGSVLFFMQNILIKKSNFNNTRAASPSLEIIYEDVYMKMHIWWLSPS